MDIKDIETYKKEMMKLYSKGKPDEQAEDYSTISEADEKIAEQFTADKENNVPTSYKERSTEKYDDISAEDEKMAEEFTAQKENTVPVEYQREKQEDSKNDNKEDYDDKAYADTDHDTSYYPYTGDDEEAELERIINSADLSDNEQPYEQALTAPSELGDSTGFILVNVRTGREATPIVGASVVITAINNGKRLLAAAGISDISGTESSVTSETELSETDNSETSAVSDTGYTAEDLAVGITIEGEHAVAMGNTISMEISLTEQGISPSILSSGVLFIAEYTSTASAPANITPAAMVITIDDTVIDVSATTSAEGMVIFEYDKIAEAVTAAGFTPADIDLLGIKSTSIPIDVNKIIISQG